MSSASPKLLQRPCEQRIEEIRRNRMYGGRIPSPLRPSLFFQRVTYFLRCDNLHVFLCIFSIVQLIVLSETLWRSQDFGMVARAWVGGGGKIKNNSTMIVGFSVFFFALYKFLFTSDILDGFAGSSDNDQGSQIKMQYTPNHEFDQRSRQSRGNMMMIIIITTTTIFFNKSRNSEMRFRMFIDPNSCTKISYVYFYLSGRYNNVRIRNELFKIKFLIFVFIPEGI